ncbi:MAG: hypothetical protein V7727_02980 [Sneathiella sp.]
MAGSKGSGDKPLIDIESLTEGSTRDVENLLRAAEQLPSVDAISTDEKIESVEFMVDDENELVDLDALFDALNVAANEGVDAMGYIEGDEAGVVLTVTNEALAKAGVSSSFDDLGATADEGLTDQVISDES